MSLVFLVVLFVVALPLFWVVSTYGQLKALRGRAALAFAQLDQHAKRRYMLIPSLVDSVRRPMSSDIAALDAVLAARGAAVAANRLASSGPRSPTALAAWSQAESRLSAALLHFLNLIENYPALKSDRDVSQLAGELVATSKKIGFGAQAYNQAVMLFNSAIAEAPASTVAKSSGFRRIELLDTDL